MKPTKLEPEDPRLATLLRASRAAPQLPPRFRAGVWRRIEWIQRPIPAMTHFVLFE